jgi:hypothetical protein
MGRFTKRLICGIAVASLFVGSASAQVVSSLLDDFRGGTNQNMFGQYWYFYDDSEESSSIASINARGTSVVHSAQKSATGELVFTSDLSIVPSDRPGGHPSANAAVLDYTLGATFRTGYDNRTPDQARNPSFPECPTSAESAALNWDIGCTDFGQFVGIGTNLVPDGRTNGPAGFQNATHLTFWAKADIPVSVRFVLETSNIGLYGNGQVKEGADFGAWFEITTTWAPYTVRFVASPCNGERPDIGYPRGCDGTGPNENWTYLVQPDWAVDQDFIGTLDLTRAVKVAWQIQPADEASAKQGNKNKEPTEPEVLVRNRFYLDQIEIFGFRFVPEDMCEDCIVAARPTTDVVRFDSFESGEPTNRLNYWWYAYDDSRVETDNNQPGTSEFAGEFVDTDSPYVNPGEKALLVNTAANTVEVLYGLGRTMLIGGHTVQPFIGIGTNLYDDDAADLVFYDAAADGVTGLYFEYYTNAPKITFEVQDNRDVLPGAGRRPESAVWYIDLPGMPDGGTPEWKRARVPFSVLTQHTEWEDVAAWVAANPTTNPLNLSALAKFQFKIQSGSGLEGDFKIREVWTLGASSGSVRQISSQARAAGLRATYNRGVVGVNWNAATPIASGKISLVNTKGRVVSSAPISSVSGNRVTANLGGRAGIPSGMYFVRIDAKDVSGKRIVQQAPITVVR